MNLQKQAPEEVTNILERAGVKYMELDYYAFPETFGTTGGPNGGGGNTISIFTVEAYVCDGEGPTVYVCNGKYRLKKEKFKMKWH